MLWGKCFTRAGVHLVIDEAVGSDCDFREAIVWRGDIQASEAGGPVVGMPILDRTSDTLRSLGFAQGIRPELTVKVVFSPDGTQTRAFAMGPGGGDAAVWRPR